MTQNERRKFLIQYLIAENSQYKNIEIPNTEEDQKYLFRSLVNVRPPVWASDEFLKIQDDYLSEENRMRGITDIADLQSVPTESTLYLWRGDITTLKIDAIVNAANSGLTGCWQPNHFCIDNCIHTFAGIQLRNVCAKIIEQQGHEEPTGQAKITLAFNLPCQFVLHTVGPIISENVTQKDSTLLASCYKSCLNLAAKNNVKSIAFCCISTGVFHFPQERAAEIAIATVKAWKEQTGSTMKVLFNVFSEKDENIYRNILYGRN